MRVVLLAVLFAGCGAADVDDEPSRRRSSEGEGEGEGEGENERDVLWNDVSAFCARDARCNNDGSACIDNVSNTIAFVRATGSDVCEAAGRSYTRWLGCVSPLSCDAAVDEACESESFLNSLVSCAANGQGVVEFSGWRCLAAYYNDGVCDCDCGRDDVDCAGDESTCEYCFVEGQQINKRCDDV